MWCPNYVDQTNSEQNIYFISMFTGTQIITFKKNTNLKTEAYLLSLISYLIGTFYLWNFETCNLTAGTNHCKYSIDLHILGKL